MSEVQDLRSQLAQCPEPSGGEEKTSRTIAAWLEGRGLQVETGIAGHGVLARTQGAAQGGAHQGAQDRPMLWRAELDAVQAHGLGHHCGHDGHMAMLCGGLAAMQEEGIPVVALFQPAEETGEGMARCLQDPRVADLDVTAAYAVHNIPGVGLGQVVVGPGAMASVGLRMRFTGASSHAAEPWQGRSPWPAAKAAADAVWDAMQGDPRATLIHLRLGTESYGTSPGTAVVAATLRGTDRSAVEALQRRLVDRPEEFRLETETVDDFPSTKNQEENLEAARRAAKEAGLQVAERDAPWPWSEDFGHALARWPGALIGLGAGTDHPALHDAEYHFPDALLEHGVRFWTALGRGGR